MKTHLRDKRNEYIWSLINQDYSLADLAVIFGLSKTQIFNVKEEMPKGWISPWAKTGNPLPTKEQLKLMEATYNAWSGLRQRCDNPNNKAYKHYGGRGISYTKRWNDFSKFLKDMGIKPSKELSIDRINNDGNYNKTNCRWATAKQQANNRRNSIN